MWLARARTLHTRERRLVIATWVLTGLAAATWAVAMTDSDWTDSPDTLSRRQALSFIGVAAAGVAAIGTSVGASAVGIRLDRTIRRAGVLPPMGPRGLPGPRIALPAISLVLAPTWLSAVLASVHVARRGRLLADLELHYRAPTLVLTPAPATTALPYQ